MKLTNQEIIEGSPAIKSTTIAYSDNFMLTVGGVLNINNNLSESDCKSILSGNILRQIQFSEIFNVSGKTLDLINKHLLSDKSPTFRFVLNDVADQKTLEVLSHLTNLKSLTVAMFRNNQIDLINKYSKLVKLGLGGDGISIKGITKQTEVEELFLFEKLKDIEVVGLMKKLKKITFSKMTLKNLDFLTNLENLRELHFMLGSATNYESLSKIGKIEKVSFTLVRKLSIEHLLPINKMKFLRELKFDSQPLLTDLDWLKLNEVKTEVLRCKNYKKARP